MTDAERALWRAMRGKQLLDCKFRRQYPIGPYIVDFACAEKKLIAELDGGQHQDQIDYDEKRTEFLQRQGWRVLRFWNNDVLNNLDGGLINHCGNFNRCTPIPGTEHRLASLCRFAGGRHVARIPCSTPFQGEGVTSER